MVVWACLRRADSRVLYRRRDSSRGQKRSAEEVQEYDEEVYDDRMFYAMLLKV